MADSGIFAMTSRVRLVFLAGVVLLAVFVVEYFSPLPEPAHKRIAVVLFVLPMIAACMAAIRARGRAHALGRVMWTLMAASCAAFSFGWVFSAAWVYQTGSYPPAGSYEDAGILLGFVLLLCSVLLLGGRPRLTAIQWARNGLDVTAVLLIAAALWYWAIFLPMHKVLLGQGLFINNSIAAYPILSVALAGFVLGFSPWRRTAWARLLVAGFVLGAFASVPVALLIGTPWQFNTNPISTGIIDVVIMSAFIMITLAGVARVDPSLISTLLPAPLGDSPPWTGVAVSLAGLAAVPLLVWLSVRETNPAYSVWFGAMAALLAVMLIGRNMTVIAENARLTDARLAAQRYSAVVESSPIAIVVMDLDGKVLFANNACVRLFEAESADDLIGRDRLEFQDPEYDHAPIDTAVADFAEEVAGSAEPPVPPAPISGPVITLKGSRVWVERTLRPISYEGHPALLSQLVDITARVSAEQASEEYRSRLGALAADLLATEEREQHKFAEVLHDEVSQPLAVCRMHLSAGVADSSVEGLHAAEAMKFLDLAIARTRSLTSQISPPFLDDLGLRKALEWLAEDFEQNYALHVVVSGDFDEDALAEDARSALYRTTRELLHNVVKHAFVNRAEVRLGEADGFVSVTVSDKGGGPPDGVDLSAPGSGFGLLSIRERLPRLGGSFEIGRGPEGGVTATARLPMTDQGE